MTFAAIKSKTIYLVIIAVFINAITSTGAFAALNPNGQSVLLCTSQGYEWVKIESADIANGSEAKQHCKLCLFPPSDDSNDEFFVDLEPSSYLALIDGKKEAAGHDVERRSQTPYFMAHGRAPPLEVLTK